MSPYERRKYRERMGEGRFRSFTISHVETDVWVGVNPGSWSEGIAPFCREIIRDLRSTLDAYIQSSPAFLESLAPLSDDPLAHPIIREMIAASARANVGPMASVAGAFAQHLGISLQNEFRPEELVIENGGDIYMKIQKPLSISIFAGTSPLSEKLGVLIPPEISTLGVCTSSGTVGHSLSFGKADAVMIGCRSALDADAYATSFCNRVQIPDDIDMVLDEIGKCPEILSGVIIAGEKTGIRGEWELVLF